MRLSVVLCLVILLGGCSTVGNVAKKTFKVWTDPSIPVGEQKDRPTMVSLSLNATESVNPNVYSDTAVSAELSETVDEQMKGTSNRLSNLAKDGGNQQNRFQHLSRVSGSKKTGIGNARTADDIESEATPISFKVVQLKDNSLMLQADYGSVFGDLKKSLGTTYIMHDDYVLTPNEFKFIEPFALEEKTRYIAVIAEYSDYPNAKWKQIIKVKPKGQEIALFANFGKREVAIKKPES